MRRRLDVEGDRVGAGLDELAHVALGALDHQVHLEHRARLAHLLGERRDDQRADRDRRDEMPVHHVDVDHPRARVEHLPHLLAQAAEVGRQDRRRDPHPAQQLARRRAHIGCSIESPQLLHFMIARRGHPHDRRVLTAVRADRGQLEAVQAVDAAVAPGQVRRAQPGLAAVGALRPEVDRRPWPVPRARPPCSAPAQAGDEEAGRAVAVGQRQHEPRSRVEGPERERGPARRARSSRPKSGWESRKAAIRRSFSVGEIVHVE